MATVLNEWPGRRAGRPRDSKYGKFLDGQIWLVPMSELGGANIASVRPCLSKLSKMRGLAVRVSLQPNDHVAIQAYKADSQ